MDCKAGIILLPCVTGAGVEERWIIRYMVLQEKVGGVLLGLAATNGSDTYCTYTQFYIVCTPAVIEEIVSRN